MFLKDDTGELRADSCIRSCVCRKTDAPRDVLERLLPFPILPGYHWRLCGQQTAAAWFLRGPLFSLSKSALILSSHVHNHLTSSDKCDQSRSSSLNQTLYAIRRWLRSSRYMELLKNQAPGEELSLLIQPARRFWDAGFADISQSRITRKPAGDPVVR